MKKKIICNWPLLVLELVTAKQAVKFESELKPHPENENSESFQNAPSSPPSLLYWLFKVLPIKSLLIVSSLSFAYKELS